MISPSTPTATDTPGRFIRTIDRRATKRAESSASSYSDPGSIRTWEGSTPVEEVVHSPSARREDMPEKELSGEPYDL